MLLCQLTAGVLDGVDLLYGDTAAFDLSGEALGFNLGESEALIRWPVAEASKRLHAVALLRLVIGASNPSACTALSCWPVPDEGARPEPLPVRLTLRLESFPLLDPA
jgi:hypothetical protein